MIYTYRELKEKKISDNDIKKMYKLDKGIYSSTEDYEELELVQKKYPKAILTLNSAAYYYGLIHDMPNQYFIATKSKAKVIKNDKIKQIFIRDENFEIGKTTLKYHDYEISIYDKERLLLEIVRYKDKLDKQFYEQIINNFKLGIKDLNIKKIRLYLTKCNYTKEIKEEIYIQFHIKTVKEVNMKGIILAGGSGTRLYPITKGVSKQLLPIYNKPMIYYPISILMLAGIKDILIITTKEDQESFKRLLKDGSQFGVNFEYIIQPSPDGLAQAFILGEEFIGDKPCALVLGDNIFYGNGLVRMLKNAVDNAERGYATNFGIEVPDPQRFGIMEIERKNDEINIISVEEKPENPKSNFAITGLYFYPKGVAEKAKEIKPSKRGELEITSLNDMYLQEQKLRAELLGGGFNWFDTGTFESLYDAVVSIKTTEQSKGRIIACLEQIAYDNGWIDDDKLMESIEVLKKNSYGKYLEEILQNKERNKTRVLKK